MPTEREVQHPDGRVERITETSAAPTTVVERRGSGMGAIVALIVGLLAVLVIGYFLMNMNRSDAVKDNAIAGAAESVGNAADNIGEAARDAVPDPVGLGAGEHEFAIGDIHLTAAEAHRIDAVFQAGHDARRVILAAQHIGVRHAWHGDMGKAFAPSVARWGNPHQPRILAVLHIAHQTPVFDQHIAGRGRAFVIDRD